jgi:hypothetical protein
MKLSESTHRGLIWRQANNMKPMDFAITNGGGQTQFFLQYLLSKAELILKNAWMSSLVFNTDPSPIPYKG